MRLAPAPQKRCLGLRGSSTGQGQHRRSVRAIQLPHRWSEHSWPQQPLPSVEEAYQRGYEEGILAAQRQQLAVAVALEASVVAPSSAPPAEPQLGSTPTEAAKKDCNCKDSMMRSAVKGLSWRFFGLAVSMLLVYFVMGGGKGGIKWSDMLKFGGMEFVAKYVTYFLHERMWASIPPF